jgi:predicted metal-dependent hydrolase
MPKRDVERFVASKEGWILERLAEAAERKAARAALTYGDAVSFRGGSFPIEAAETGAGFDGNSFRLPPGLSPEEVQAACAQLLKTLAKQDLTRRTRDWALLMSVEPAAVGITGAKTRWGSCSGKKSVNFSWRLIMADDDAIDYVVVHELEHLSEMNHSPRFWAIVERFLPDWRERRAKLARLQRKLGSEAWA